MLLLLLFYISREDKKKLCPTDKDKKKDQREMYGRCSAGRVPIMGQHVSSNSNGGGCIIDPADPALTK